MLNLPELKFKITGDGSGALKELDLVSKRIGEIGKKMSDAGKGMSVAITTPITAALTAAVKGASDLTETLGKTDVVFGNMSDSVKEWASNSIDSMGLAQQTALDMAATYGDMATGMGLAQGEAAKMATSLVQLGADMASFKNIGIDEVNTALTAVFTGETESLKRLGIVMTQANLQQYALSQGITTQIEKMSQVEQVQLRYQYVMAMTANAQGDFLRTGGNLANQMRSLGESVKELGTGFGELIVPVVTRVVSALREGVNAITQMDDGTKRMMISIGMVVAAVGPLLLVGGKLLSLISSIGVALAANPIGLAVGGLLAAVAAIGAVTAAMSALAPEVDTASESYQSLKNSIVEGAAGKVTIDTSEVPESVEVNITANGEQALAEARGIVQTLDTDPQFDGKLKIDGDPEKAERVIADIQADIEAVDKAVKIDGDPQQANDALEQLEQDINNLKGAVKYAEDPETKEALEQAITALEGRLAALKVNITYTTEGEEGLAQYQAYLDTLPPDTTYRATGEFSVTAESQQMLKDYADALGEAATATEGYADAVEAMNKITDTATQDKQKEIIEQLTEEQRYLTAAYNDGLLTQDEYNQKIQESNDQAREQIANITEEGEARKEIAKQLANGTEVDDLEAQTKLLRDIWANEHLTTEEMGQGARRINEGTSQDVDFDSALQRQHAIEQQTEKYGQLAQAVLEYNAAMQEANETEQGGEYVSMEGSGTAVRADEAIERANALKEMVEAYEFTNSHYKGGQAPEEALQIVSEQFADKLEAYEGLEENLRSILTGEDGELIGSVEAEGKANELDTFIGECQEKIDSAKEQADQMRQTAMQSLADSATQLGENYTQGSVDAAIAQIEQLSGPLDAAQKQILQNTPSLIEEIGKAAETGDMGTIQAAIDKAFENVDVESAASETGKNTDAGYASGMRDNVGEVESAAAESGQAAIDSLNEAAGCASPSTKTEETGRNVIQGLVNGLQDTGAAGAAAQTVGESVVESLDAALANNNLSSALGSSVRTAVGNAAPVASAGGQSVGSDLIGGVSSGVSAGDNVSSAIGSAVREAVGSASNIAYSGGQSVGKNLMSGVHNGVLSAAGSIATAAANAVRNAIAAAKAAANIQSPSRTMRDEVGVMLMRGVEVGMSERAPATLQIIQESMRGLISGATKVVNQNGIPAPAVAIPAPSGPAIDYERLADANASRPVILSVGAKRMAQATRDEAARQQAIRVAQINAGYGGR